MKWHHIFLTAALFLISFTAVSLENRCHLDSFGTSKSISIEACAQYYKEFQQLQDELLEGDFLNKKKPDVFLKLTELIENNIRKKYDFALVSLANITYPDRSIYFTLDVVEKSELARLHYFKSQSNYTKDIQEVNFLFDLWAQYEKYGYSQLFKQTKSQSCPSMHCLFAFESDAVKISNEQFFKLAPKHKKTLVDILMQDKNAQKRSRAAYLIGYLSDVDFVSDTLSEAMLDPSSSVRNSVMRVLSFASPHHDLGEKVLKKAIQALDFPFVTDRNKSLHVVLPYASKSKYQTLIRQTASMYLVKNLQSTQPNCHSVAYEILTKISGQQYAETDYASWGKWAQSVQQS